MSLPLLKTTVPQPLLAAAIGRPIAQFTPMAYSGAPLTGTGDARVFTAEVDWKFYGAAPNMPVYLSINLASLTPQSSLDAIRSCYIDNTFSATPVYVYFPDTEFTVFCPAYACVMSPVFTNSNNVAYIFADQFSTALNPFTTVQFANSCHAGFVIMPAASGSGVAPAPTGLTISRILLIGGGGGGGNHPYNNTGGGGGGGMIDDAIPFVLSPGAYPITVGVGGSVNSSGGNSSLGTFVAIGGGGGLYGAPGMPGGSGGGGGGGNDGGAGSTGGAGTAGQGFGGSNGRRTAGSQGGGGGGGGAGGMGLPGSGVTFNGAGGGPGKASDISGTSIFYAGGGGGGAPGGANAVAPGGTGGGGRGSYPGGNVVAQAGTDGLGGGGGGGGGSWPGQRGGSGIVIIRYAGAPAATGGVITAVGSDTIHTFSASGVFTVL